MGYGKYSTLGLNQSQSKQSTMIKLIDTREFFDFFNCIGRGATSRVLKVKFRQNRQYFALKEMLKYQLAQKKAIELAFNERDNLLALNNGYVQIRYNLNRFIGNLYCSFQDKENLYLLFDLLSGGDLRYHLSRDRHFNEEQIRFFAACLILAIEYIHSKGVVHRDIKPENILCDDRGYLRLTDFGISKKLDSSSALPIEINGTYGYIAPELILSHSFSYEADYFALGAVLFELCIGGRPYHAKTKYEMIQEYKERQIKLCIEDLPNGFTRKEELCDFINQLLSINPKERLGHNGVQELKKHKLFTKFNWNELTNKTMISPFIPKPTEQHSNRPSGSEKLTAEDKDELLIRNEKENDENFQKLFNDFSNFEFIQKAKSLKFNQAKISVFKQTSLIHLRRDSSNFGQQANSTARNFLSLKQTPMKLKLASVNSYNSNCKEKMPSSFFMPKNCYSSKKGDEPSTEFPNINKMKWVSPHERRVSVPKEKMTALSLLTKNLFYSKRLKKNHSLSILKME